MPTFPAPAIDASAQIGAVPSCPNAHTDASHEVRTYAGAGGERRTYNCMCGITWNQKRPDKLAPGEDPDVRQSNRAALGGAKRSGREYKCGHCGEPKKGHVCTVGGGDVNKRAKTSPPPPTAVSPPLSPMRREQYDDMLKFSAPPTDGELLAFLRKYDLRPSEATDLYKSMQSYQRALNVDSMLSTPEDVVAAMTQLAGEPEVAITAYAIAMAEAGSACSAEEIVASSIEAASGELSLEDFIRNLDACADCGDDMVGDDLNP